MNIKCMMFVCVMKRMMMRKMRLTVKAMKEVRMMIIKLITNMMREKDLKW